MKLRVDANAGYSYSDAYKFIRKTSDLDLEMYEQLLDKHDFNGTKQLKRDTGFVIGVDEAINTVQEAVRYGNVSGSLSVQQKGAISSLPTREQVEQFLAEHKN